MSAVARIAVVIVAVGTISAGCGAAGGTSAATATSDSAKSTSFRSESMTLKEAVRAAIRGNVQLSSYVLWHNAIPKWATSSTRGPALASLGSAAATRRAQGIEIKNLSGHYTIVSIVLDPSYATATAIVRSEQRVAPFKSGRRLGKAILAADHVRIQLHRLDNARHFVVWRVTSIK